MVRVSAAPPSDDDDADDHGGHHGDAGECQGHVDRVVVAQLHSPHRVALKMREMLVNRPHPICTALQLTDWLCEKSWA